MRGRRCRRGGGPAGAGCGFRSFGTGARFQNLSARVLGMRLVTTSGAVRGRYPGWARFQAVRARLDPDGIFANDYVTRVLGPIGVPPDLESRA